MFLQVQLSIKLTVKSISYPIDFASFHPTDFLIQRKIGLPRRSHGICSGY